MFCITQEFTIMAKKEKTRIDALIELYHTLSNEDLMHLLNLAKERFFVWNPNDNTCYELDRDIPCCPNGSQIQINIEEDNIKLKPMVSKEE